jgi:hypothetical protein
MSYEQPNKLIVIIFETEFKLCPMEKALIVLAVILSACTAKQEQIILFNEQNGDNQMIVLREDTVETAVFYIEDGVLTVSGNPFGYIRTTERYENYELNLEWRWVEEPSNSGVLLHISGDDQVWPHCVEAQLKHESAGDFVLIREGARATIDGQDHALEPGGHWASSIKKMQPSSEKPPGEWNHYRIVTLDGNVSFL